MAGGEHMGASACRWVEDSVADAAAGVLRPWEQYQPTLVTGSQDSSPGGNGRCTRLPLQPH